MEVLFVLPTGLNDTSKSRSDMGVEFHENYNNFITLYSLINDFFQKLILEWVFLFNFANEKRFEIKAVVFRVYS